MAAKRKNSKHNNRIEDGRDKPEFAADWFQPERVQKKDKAKDKPNDDTAKLSEALNNQIQDKLERMKAALLKEAEEAEATQAAKATGKRMASSKSLPKNASERNAAQRTFTDDEKENLSFAELFEGSDAQDEAFEDLLNDSALDWRKFKDE